MLKITILAALGVAALSLPAQAAPAVAPGTGLKAAAASDVVQVRHRRWHRYHGRSWRRARNPGSLRYEGPGYAYGRYSGQTYRTCQFDEGYGRVRPCDAGSR